MIRFSVHECLFCPQTFDSASAKDDHVLEHFAQEICADCDQILIRIGNKLYTIHDGVTCVQREVKTEQHFKMSLDDQHDNHRQHLTDQCEIKTEPNPNEPSNNQIPMSHPVNYTHPTEVVAFKIELEETGAETIESVSTAVINTDQNEQLSNECDALDDEMQIKIEATIVEDGQQKIFSAGIDPIRCEIPNLSPCLERKSSKVKEVAVCQQKVPTKKRPTKKESLACELCGNVLGSRRNLKRHKLLVHSDPETKSRLCTICCKLFSSPETLAEHRPGCLMNKRILNKDKGNKYMKFGRFECDICLRLFNTKKYIRDHIYKQHVPNYMPFKCKTCGIKFVKESAFKKHVCRNKLDRKIKTVKCEFCWTTLSSKQALHRHHLLIHTKPGTILCKSCSTEFPNDDELNQHRPECLKKRTLICKEYYRRKVDKRSE